MVVEKGETLFIPETRDERIYKLVESIPEFSKM
jgi:hypothetical protein